MNENEETIEQTCTNCGKRSHIAKGLYEAVQRASRRDLGRPAKWFCSQFCHEEWLKK